MIDLLCFLLIGLAVGWLAGRIKTDQSSGLVGNLAIGVIGAVLGGFILPLVGLSAIGLLGSLTCATAGAILLLLLFQDFGKRPQAGGRTTMAGQGRQMPRKPATKFANLRKKMEKNRVVSKVGEKK